MLYFEGSCCWVMLCDSSCCAITQTLPSIHILYLYPHIDTLMKAFKVSNFQWSLQVALAFILFWKSPSTNCNTNDKYFFLVKVSWDVANWHTTRQCPHNIAMPQTMFAFHIHASNVLQIQATCLYKDHFQMPSNQI